MSTTLSLVPWIIIGSVESIRISQMYLTILLMIQNIGAAMSDVVIDAMMAEAIRSERASFAGDLQSLSWFSMAFGGICGSLSGGYTLSHFKLETIFLLFSIFPGIQLVSCAFVEERKKYSFDDKTDSAKKDKKASDNIVRIWLSFFQKTLKSVNIAFYRIFHAFKQPAIIRPIAWFFLSYIAVPDLSTIMFYYQTEVLHLDPSFLGKTQVIGWFGLMIGTFTYNRYLKHVRLWKILLWTQISLAILNCLHIVLVSRINIQLGISDRYMVLSGSALASAIRQFSMMPFLIISGQLCPPGIEGTLFALFMSIHNFGGTVSNLLGAGLASFLNISSKAFDNLLYGVVLQSISHLIPILFLVLIPKEATGLSS